MFAVVVIGNKQYKVAQGDILEVERLPQPVGETVVFDRVLLTSNGTTVVGTPIVSGFKIKAKVLEHKKGPKLDIRRFKAKVRERKKKGFRPILTKIEIVSIGKT